MRESEDIFGFPSVLSRENLRGVAPRKGQQLVNRRRSSRAALAVSRLASEVFVFASAPFAGDVRTTTQPIEKSDKQRDDSYRRENNPDQQASDYELVHFRSLLPGAVLSRLNSNAAIMPYFCQKENKNRLIFEKILTRYISHLMAF